MLRLEELRAGYDRRECLHGVTGEIAPSGLTAIIGPNGCGKTTLMKCAAGLLRPMGGTIFLNGRSYQEITDRERARFVSYMPQSRSAPDISVRQLVTHGRYPHLKWGQSLRAADRRIVEDAIRRAGLGDYARRSVSRLSGGERQRAYLAMMLAQQTPVMLLDEPTTYLDLSARFELMDLLRELCRESRSVVAVLHDLPLALEYADKVLLMQDGHLIASGTPEEVYLSGKISEVFGVDATRLPDGRYIFSKHRQEAHK